MRSLRRRLRVLATTWVVFQAVSLSVLVAPWCCLGLQSAEVPAGGPPCPMHQQHGSAHGHHGPAPEHETPGPDCAMRAACGGQAAALFVALSHVGILQDSIAVHDSRSADVPVSSYVDLIPQFRSPDAPPPRA